MIQKGNKLFPLHCIQFNSEDLFFYLKDKIFKMQHQ
nr:MAG TPA: hypothetical protein [Caudoviricetes sp.]